MMRHVLTGCALALSLAASGCGLTGGQTVVRYDRNQPLRMTEAPKDGRYGLYSSSDRTPQVTYELSKGDQIGFKESDGQINAVAGPNQQPIQPSMMTGTFYWKEVEE